MFTISQIVSVYAVVCTWILKTYIYIYVCVFWKYLTKLNQGNPLYVQSFVLPISKSQFPHPEVKIVRLNEKIWFHGNYLAYLTWSLAQSTDLALGCFYYHHYCSRFPHQHYIYSSICRISSWLSETSDWLKRLKRQILPFFSWAHRFTKLKFLHLMYCLD